MKIFQKKIYLLPIFLGLLACDSRGEKGLELEKFPDISGEKSNSPYIDKIFEYRPAVGQFINQIPAYENGDSYEKILQKVAQEISGTQKGMISLGGFGGYVVFGFDHHILNLEGADFKILNNAFTGSSEPGVIWVAYDANENHLPDDKWYQIAGSEYHKPTTIQNYQITYQKPQANKPRVPGTYPWQYDMEYIQWSDNQSNKGFIIQNSYHKQSYFPLWENANELHFTATRLADNYTQTGNFWSGKAYDFGYADAQPGGDLIDISWAVDENGQKVNLKGIKFVKIQNGIRQEAGWLGEISTEIRGAEDLHWK